MRCPANCLKPKPMLRAFRFLAAWIVAGAVVTGAVIASTVIAGANAEDRATRLVRPVQAAAFQAVLRDVTPDWRFTFFANDEPRTLAVDELVAYGAYRDTDIGPQILLADGGRLRADVLEITPNIVKVESSLWLEADLRLAAVRAIVLSPPTDPQARDALERTIRESAGGQDQLLLASGDRLGGQLTPDAEGRIWSSDSSELLRIKTEGRELEVPTERIRAIVFNPSLVERPRARGVHALVGFRDGSQLLVERMEQAADGGQVQTIAGATLLLDSPAAAPEGSLWADVTSIQPLGTDVIYLSDLKPVSYRHIPFLTREWPYRENACVTGGRLRVNGRVYSKGIGMHSTSRLAYAASGYSRLEAELAIDDSADERGSVVFRVFVNDAGGEWRAAFESPVVRHGASPLPMSVDLAGVRAIALIVDYAEWGDIGDHANWLDARLIPQ